MDSELFVPDFDLGRFRHAVARYVKHLIRARWKSDPGFLPDDELRAWNLQNIDDDRLPAWHLLKNAAHDLGELNHHYLPRCGSGGVRPTDDQTPEGRLISEVAFFTDFSGGGPCHNLSLLDAAENLRAGRKVKWTDLVDWANLRKIRADLDKLPQPGEHSSERHIKTIVIDLSSRNDTAMITIDNVAHLVARRFAQWFKLIAEADGEFVGAAERDAVSGLKGYRPDKALGRRKNPIPEQIRELIERKAGAGTRIVGAKLSVTKPNSSPG